MVRRVFKKNTGAGKRLKKISPPKLLGVPKKTKLRLKGLKKKKR